MVGWWFYFFVGFGVVDECLVFVIVKELYYVFCDDFVFVFLCLWDLFCFFGYGLFVYNG